MRTRAHVVDALRLLVVNFTQNSRHSDAGILNDAIALLAENQESTDLLDLIEDRDKLKAAVLKQDRLIREVEKAIDTIRITNWGAPPKEWPPGKRVESVMESLRTALTNAAFFERRSDDFREKINKLESVDGVKGGVNPYHHLKASVIDFLGIKTGGQPGERAFDEISLVELKDALHHHPQRKPAIEGMYNTLKTAIIETFGLEGPAVHWTMERLVDVVKNNPKQKEPVAVVATRVLELTESIKKLQQDLVKYL